MSETMMTCDRCDELLADYFEGELDQAMSEAAALHIATCARCQGIVRDVNAIRESAAAMSDIAPSRDLWAGIEQRIQPAVVPIAARRAPAPMSRAFLATAAAALIVVSSSVTYVAARPDALRQATQRSERPATQKSDIRNPPVGGGGGEAKAPAGEAGGDRAPRPSATAGGRTAAPVRAVASPRPDVTLASSATREVLSEEIDDLQVLLLEKRDALDPATVRVVEENLAIIDAAVQQARTAVEQDPGSGFLNGRLDKALQKKVELLRTVALLPSTT